MSCKLLWRSGRFPMYTCLIPCCKDKALDGLAAALDVAPGGPILFGCTACPPPVGSETSVNIPRRYKIETSKATLAAVTALHPSGGQYSWGRLSRSLRPQIPKPSNNMAVFASFSSKNRMKAWTLGIPDPSIFTCRTALEVSPCRVNLSKSLESLNFLSPCHWCQIQLNQSHLISSNHWNHPSPPRLSSSTHPRNLAVKGNEVQMLFAHLRQSLSSPSWYTPPCGYSFELSKFAASNGHLWSTSKSDREDS